MVDIREVSKEEKEHHINRVKVIFGDIRDMLKVLECDMESSELMVQASAIWIGSNLCTWYSDFRKQIADLDKAQSTLNQLKNEIKEAAEDVSVITSDPSVH